MRAPLIEVVDGGEIAGRSEAGEIFREVGAAPGVTTSPGGSVPLASDRLHLFGGTIATNAEAADGGEVKIQAKQLCGVHPDPFSEKLAELLLRNTRVLEDLHKELGTHALALVDCEEEDATVGVDQEAVAPASAGLTEACAEKRRQDPAGGELGKPSHRLCSDLDFDGD